MYSNSSPAEWESKAFQPVQLMAQADSQASVDHAKAMRRQERGVL
jgi:hypothetical protein